MDDFCTTGDSEIEPATPNVAEPSEAAHHPVPTDLRTVAFARAAHMLALSALVTLTERGLISRADALTAIDCARAFATVDPDSEGAWRAARVVLDDSRGALQIVFSEIQARAAGAFSKAMN